MNHSGTNRKKVRDTMFGKSLIKRITLHVYLHYQLAPKSREAMEKLYYSLGDDETLSQKLKKVGKPISEKMND